MGKLNSSKEWILVKDNPPDIGKRYIILDLKGSEIVGFFNGEKWICKGGGYLFNKDVDKYKEIL